MNKYQKKLIIGFLVVILITPIGILIPYWLKAGNAWGEWSVNTIKEKIGFVPEGMQKNAEIWKAPLADYGLEDENSSLAKKSGNYLISGFVGVAVISILSYGLFKIIKKE